MYRKRHNSGLVAGVLAMSASFYWPAPAVTGEIAAAIGAHAGRIAWAARHCPDGQPTHTARLLVETWAGSPDFDSGERDASEAGEADLSSSCAAIDVLYGPDGLAARGLWEHASVERPPQS